MPVQIPDDADFSSFREQCVSAAGWRSRYSRGGVTVWDREEESREEDSRQEESRSVQRLKVSLLGGFGEEGGEPPGGEPERPAPQGEPVGGMGGKEESRQEESRSIQRLKVSLLGGLGGKEESRQEESRSIQLLKMRIVCKDVTAETLYDVLHDTSYRKKWDSNMIDTYDIGRLTANADVGYYSWKCPSPLKNRDFVTMRSWLPLGNDYLIINYSVKHPQHPPKKDYVRAVSLLTGYLIQSNGASCSTLYYLTQMDPRGSLPKWVVNRASQFVAPKAMRKIYKASLKYPDWKRKHNPSLKPWMFPEQNTLPCISVSELNVQRADSLENIDESGLSEDKTHHSEDEET